MLISFLYLFTFWCSFLVLIFTRGLKVTIFGVEINCESVGSMSFIRPHKKILVSRPLKIEKVMRACDIYFHFLSFLQGQIEIFETRTILHFPLIM